MNGDSDKAKLVAAVPAVGFGEAFLVWLKIAGLSFGGPAGQIAVMHRLLVEEKRWLSEGRFLHALNYCMLLPGPEAMQLATYSGWLLHGVRGGLVAGLLFILPGFLSILLLSGLYVAFSGVPWLEALFYGIKPAVVAVVFAALLGMAQRSLAGAGTRLLALTAFLAMFVFAVPFPWVIILAGLSGLWLFRRRAPVLAPGAELAKGEAQGPVEPVCSGPAAQPAPSGRAALRTGLTWAGVWLLPVLCLWLWLGPEHLFTELALFFSKLALFTFGGAYAALAYLAQEAVQTHGWLSAAEMLDGLGLAESTPGPLIQVVQFVAYLAPRGEALAMAGWQAGLLASLLVTWVTFAPSFLWIFLGAPFMERLRDNRWLNAALTAVSAAVVGVILNLALWFALHVLFHTLKPLQAGPVKVLLPQVNSVDWTAAALAVAAFLLLRSRRLGLVPVLLLSALAGAGAWLAGWVS